MKKFRVTQDANYVQGYLRYVSRFAQNVTELRAKRN